MNAALHAYVSKQEELRSLSSLAAQKSASTTSFRSPIPRTRNTPSTSAASSNVWIYTVAIVLLAIALQRLISRLLSSEPNDERAVRYDIQLPRQLTKDYNWDLSCLKASTVRQSEIHDGKILPHCPADGRMLCDPIVPATSKDIDVAISRATQAQSSWQSTTFSQRRRVLQTILKYVVEHQDAIVTACCLDSGKTKIDASFGEILVTAEKLQWTIKHGERALSPSKRPTNLLMCYKTNTVIYEPLGVVAACVSWNYPFHNFISPVISAIFSGNGIVVKPSEQTCWSTQYFVEIVRQALMVCGHDENLVQAVVCLPDVADHLTSHPGIQHITFIGSREVAHKVCASAARSLTPVTVELGGKDAAIVLDDKKTIASSNDVCAILMRGVFQSAGQNCIGIERVIALPGVYDKVLRIVEDQIGSMRLGSALLESEQPPDMGSLISDRSFAQLERLLDDAVRSGAKLHCGGRTFQHLTYPNGYYFQPTLLSNVTSNMKIARTEVFAPLFLLMRADNVEEAIDIANSTTYGLGASVFGHKHADVQKCVRRVRTGMVAVNDFGSYYACSLPFGGVKGSGYGRFGGEEGLRGLCNIKAVCEDASWAKTVGMRTQIPSLLQYPIREGVNGFQMCQGIVELGYSPRLVDKMVGLGKMWAATRSTPSQTPDAREIRVQEPDKLPSYGP